MLKIFLALAFTLSLMDTVTAFAEKKSAAPAAPSKPDKLSNEDRATTEALQSRVEKLDKDLTLIEQQEETLALAKANIRLKREKVLAEHEAQWALIRARYSLGPTDGFNFNDGVIKRAPVPQKAAQATPATPVAPKK